MMTIHTWASVSVPRECCFSSDFSSPCSSDTLRWSCSISACWQSASSFSSATHPFSLSHLKECHETPDSTFLLDLQKWISNCEMVGWSLMSLFSTNMAISETILTVRIQEPTILTVTLDWSKTVPINGCTAGKIYSSVSASFLWSWLSTGNYINTSLCITAQHWDVVRRQMEVHWH